MFSDVQWFTKTHDNIRNDKPRTIEKKFAIVQMVNGDSDVRDFSPFVLLAYYTVRESFFLINVIDVRSNAALFFPVFSTLPKCNKTSSLFYDYWDLAIIITVIIIKKKLIKKKNNKIHNNFYLYKHIAKYCLSGFFFWFLFLYIPKPIHCWRK